MSERIFIQPAPGLTVRKPVGGYLAEAGEEVNRDSYWLRRLADGDVRLAKPAAIPAEGKPAPKNGDKSSEKK
jgi:hypothetical protein